MRTTPIKAARRLGDFEGNEDGWASERVVDTTPQGGEVGEFNYIGDEAARSGRQPKRGQDQPQQPGQVVEQGSRQNRMQSRVAQGVEQGSSVVSGGMADPGLAPWGSPGAEIRARVTQQVDGVWRVLEKGGAMVVEDYGIPLEVHRVKGEQRVHGELGAWGPPKPIAKSQGGSKASLGWGSGKEVRLAYGQWGRQVKRAGQGEEQDARRSSWWSRGSRAEQGAEQGRTLGSRVRGGGLFPVAVIFVPPNPNPKVQGGAKDSKGMGSDVDGEVDAEQRAQGVQGARGAAVQGGAAQGAAVGGAAGSGTQHGVLQYWVLQHRETLQHRGTQQGVLQRSVLHHRVLEHRVLQRRTLQHRRVTCPKKGLG